MQVNRAGMATGLLNVALRYMHAPCEVLSLSDLEANARHGFHPLLRRPEPGPPRRAFRPASARDRKARECD